MARRGSARSHRPPPAATHTIRDDPALAGRGAGRRRTRERCPPHHAGGGRRATVTLLGAAFPLSAYASGVHLRGVVAATAGVCAAVTAHALDATGRLPFVHESVDVRTAMSPAQLVAWLAIAAAVSALAATTRVLVVGVPGALLVSAAPELLG